LGKYSKFDPYKVKLLSEGFYGWPCGKKKAGNQSFLPVWKIKPLL